MIYLFIFGGSYLLFFVASALYVMVTRNNVASVCRERGMSEEMIEAQLNAEEWQSWSVARRSTFVSGTAFGFLIALTYTYASRWF